MPPRFPGDEEIPVVAMTDDNMCRVSAQSCRWGCGNQCAHPGPNTSGNEYFGSVASRFVSRRSVLGAGGVAAGMLVVGRAAMGGARVASAAPAPGGAAGGESGLTFTPVSLNGDDAIVVPPGYKSEVLIRWGTRCSWTRAPVSNSGSRRRPSSRGSLATTTTSWASSRSRRGVGC